MADGDVRQEIANRYALYLHLGQAMYARQLMPWWRLRDRWQVNREIGQLLKRVRR